MFLRDLVALERARQRERELFFEISWFTQSSCCVQMINDHLKTLAFHFPDSVQWLAPLAPNPVRVLLTAFICFSKTDQKLVSAARIHTSTYIHMYIHTCQLIPVQLYGFMMLIIIIFKIISLADYTLRMSFVQNTVTTGVTNTELEGYVSIVFYCECGPGVAANMLCAGEFCNRGCLEDGDCDAQSHLPPTAMLASTASGGDGASPDPSFAMIDNDADR